MREFDLIARIRARVRNGDGVVLGIGDDAAILEIGAGEQFVVSTDTLVSGVHFPLDTKPGDVGYKALAVNLSDLAAMGARPRFVTLALSLPSVDPGFVEPLLEALIGLGEAHGVSLVGGDTTRGPLSLTITAIGSVPAGTALRRDGAQSGDAVFVSGALGDAAAALSLRGLPFGSDPADKLARDRLAQRLARPTPRVALGQALRGCAHACIDVSDGLAADLGHICVASGLAAVIDPLLLPASRALTMLVPDAERRLELQFGGDDYELCFTLPPEREAELDAIAAEAHVALTRIGTLGPGSGVHLLGADGRLTACRTVGYQHFA